MAVLFVFSVGPRPSDSGLRDVRLRASDFESAARTTRTRSAGIGEADVECGGHAAALADGEAAATEIRSAVLSPRRSFTWSSFHLVVLSPGRPFTSSFFHLVVSPLVALLIVAP